MKIANTNQAKCFIFLSSFSVTYLNFGNDLCSVHLNGIFTFKTSQYVRSQKERSELVGLFFFLVGGGEVMIQRAGSQLSEQTESKRNRKNEIEREGTGPQGGGTGPAGGPGCVLCVFAATIQGS